MPPLGDIFNTFFLNFAIVADMTLYESTFDGMKLAGIVIICCGFMVVLFPENWPDLLQTIIR